MEELPESLDTQANLRDKRVLAGIVLICLIFGGTLLSLISPRFLEGKSAPVRYVPAGGELESVEESGEIVVHVAGAVVRPEVYRLPAGSRVFEALAAAGGYREDADVSFVERNLNLAVPLADGDKIYIPFLGEASPASPAPGSGGTTVLGGQSLPRAGGTKININQASVEELVAAGLYRVGPKTAQQIVAYREQIGGYSSLEELLNIPGIGEKTLARLRDRLVVE